VASGLVALVLGLAAAPTWAAGTSGGNSLTQIKKDLIVRSDFPAGWTSQGSVTTSKGGSQDFPGENQLASCLGVSKSLISMNAPSTTSPSFQSSDSSATVQDNVTAFPKASVAAAVYASFSNQKVPSCMTSLLEGPAKKQLTQAIGQGVTIGAISVTPASAGMLVPNSSGFTIAFPLKSNGVTVHTAVTIVTLVRGKYGSQLTLTSADKPFPTALAHHLLAVAASRT
jgi:hypothetical protein